MSAESTKAMDRLTARIGRRPFCGDGAIRTAIGLIKSANQDVRAKIARRIILQSGRDHPEKFFLV